jgi:NADH-quinone oxidoreductase subunit F
MFEDSPKLLLPEIPDYNKIDVYIEHGGYNAFRKALRMTPDEIIEEVKKSKLRGRGGAAFPTGLKWSFMPKDRDMIKYLCVNGDESEPGSFKDRQIFEFNPHQLIEGTLIASYAMGVRTAYIYIRGEYHKWQNILQTAIDEAYEQGLLGDKLEKNLKEQLDINYRLDFYIHKGAGAYICGEETAQMTSIEGDRGYPRVRPPFPAQSGLWKKPTTVNNVETITNIPKIIEMGGEAYSKIGAEGHPGTLLFGVSGHVNKPGVYELPSGTLLTDIINKVCGGVRGDKKIKAVIPGGSSMPPLRGDEIEGVRMDEESLKKLGTHIGTGGIIVMDEETDVVKVLLRLIHFYHHESCGQCTPCREGCGWMEKILNRIINGEGSISDLDLLLSIAEQIEGNTVCALGDAAAWPVKGDFSPVTGGFINKFREDFEKAVKENRTFRAPNVVHGRRNTAETLVETV